MGAAVVVGGVTAGLGGAVAYASFSNENRKVRPLLTHG